MLATEVHEKFYLNVTKFTAIAGAPPRPWGASRWTRRGAGNTPGGGRSLADRYGVMGVGQSADLRRLARCRARVCALVCEQEKRATSGGGRKRMGSFHIGWLSPSHPLSLCLSVVYSTFAPPLFFFFKREIPSFFIKPFKGSAFSRCLVYTGKAPKERKCMGVEKTSLTFTWWLLRLVLWWRRERSGLLQMLVSSWHLCCLGCFCGRSLVLTLVGWLKLVGRVSSGLCLELVLRSWIRLISWSLTLLPVNGGYYKDQTQKWMINSWVVCEKQTKF